MDELNEVIKEFFDETAEQLALVQDDVLGLERGRDPEAVNRIFRVFHTVKGNAGMLGFDHLSLFTHQTEELLDALRKGDLAVDAEIVDLILDSVDTIRDLIAAIRRGEGDSLPTSELTARLARRLQARGVPAPESPGGPLRILVVEDDFTSRQLMNIFLGRYGECHVAKDGLEAIEAFEYGHDSPEGRPYGLICMDICMPRLDGTEATRRIRQLERQRGIRSGEVKIVITSSVSDPSMIVKACYECGADHYFVKPLDFEQMDRQLRKMGFEKKTGGG